MQENAIASGKIYTAVKNFTQTSANPTKQVIMIKDVAQQKLQVSFISPKPCLLVLVGLIYHLHHQD